MHLIKKLKIDLAAPADHDIVQSDLLKGDGLVKPTTGTRYLDLEFVQIEHSLATMSVYYGNRLGNCGLHGPDRAGYTPAPLFSPQDNLAKTPSL
jgi:hypothetical protein